MNAPREPISPEVLCIGHAAYDISLFVRGFPAENSKTETGQSLECGGGPAANAAYLLSWWGVPCAFAGLVGDDLYGRQILAEFERVGTDLSLVEKRSGHATPLSFILVNLTHGSHTLINRKTQSAALRLPPDGLARISPKILLFDGHELEASLAALEVFPEALSILDAGSLREGTTVLAGKVNYLIASEKFARQVCGLARLDQEEPRRACVRGLKASNGNIVAVTLGEQGLIADDGDGYFQLPAFKAKALDTTGAGDIFHGAFAYALAQAQNFRAALRFASMAASLSVEKQGGRPSIPALDEVIGALEKYTC